MVVKNLRWKPKLTERDWERERIVTKFLWYPKKIGDEIRYLETAKIRQRVLKVDVGGSMEWGKNKLKWCDVRWED